MRLGKVLYSTFVTSALFPIGYVTCKRFVDHPLFLVGVGRSGTTALILALGKHTALLSGGEAHILSHLGGIAYHHQTGPTARAYRASCRMPLGRLQERLRQLGFSVVFGSGHGIVGAVLLPRLRDGKKVRSVQRWVAKTFPDKQEAQGLVGLYPNAQFIYLHRDGIGTVASRMKFEGFRDTPFDAHCHNWAVSARKFSYLTDWNRSLVVRHEDLVFRRKETFARVFDFLGVKQEQAPVEFAANTVVHPEQEATMNGTNATAFFKGRASAWESWSEEQRRLFKRICGDAMRDLGYEIPS